jgi:hypothetical protein
MSRRRAFIIGENGPTEGTVKPLMFAEQDASRLARLLCSEALGYEIAHSGPRTAAQHLSELDAFASDGKRDDLLVVYFSGHGYLPKTGLYLLCGTTILTRCLATTAIPLSMVRSILENCATRTKILILDCCHSGAAASAVWGAKAALESPGSRLDAETRDAASLVIAASERFSSARESPELGGGIMTSFLIEALQTPNGSDKDRDGRLSVADTMEWLRLRTREYNANREPHEQVDIPILYGDLRGDVYLTADFGTSASARAATVIHESVAEVRKEFATGRRMEIKILQKLAKPIAIHAPTLTSLAVVDDLLRVGDDAALFSATVVIHTRREISYASALIGALGPHVRDAALWSMLRALRRVFRSGKPQGELLARLAKNLRAITQDPERAHKVQFEPNAVFGRVLSLVEQLGMAPRDVFSAEQLSRRVPIGARGQPRQWSGKVRLYYEGKDCRLNTNSYVTFVDFVDEIYERLRAEGSPITSYAYGIDWVLEAKGARLPSLSPSDPTTLLDLGIRDDERVRFVQLVSNAALESRLTGSTPEVPNVNDSQGSSKLPGSTKQSPGSAKRKVKSFAELGRMLQVDEGRPGPGSG